MWALYLQQTSFSSTCSKCVLLRNPITSTYLLIIDETFYLIMSEEINEYAGNFDNWSSINKISDFWSTHFTKNGSSKSKRCFWYGNLIGSKAKTLCRKKKRVNVCVLIDSLQSVCNGHQDVRFLGNMMQGPLCYFSMLDMLTVFYLWKGVQQKESI